MVIYNARMSYPYWGCIFMYKKTARKMLKHSYEQFSFEMV